MNDSDRFANLSDPQFHEIHAACESFELALQTQEPATIEDWLAKASFGVQDPLFRELLAIELERNPPVDERHVVQYGARFPNRSVDIEQVVQEVSMTCSDEQGDPPASLEQFGIRNQDCDSRYRLDGEIARGGMGVIFRGRDIDLGRDLAIKVLHDCHKDKPEIIQRFVEEARISGQLQHPGISPIYELGQFADNRPFFAMKLVQGETLAQLIAGRKSSVEGRGKFIGIFEQICQTMAYAHSRGVIHRDLKPANVMVGAFGEVQVMDWGLAKVLTVDSLSVEGRATEGMADESVHSRPQPNPVPTQRSPVNFEISALLGSGTQMGSVMGTPAYMPPEQALGEIDHLDERADVFGLGAILCEILTDKPPYIAGTGTSVLSLASRGELNDCHRRLNSCEADDELIVLVKHCLEPKREDRPSDAGVVAKRVCGYLESVEVRLRAAEVQRAAEAARADAQAAQALSETRRVEQQQLSARKLRKLLVGLSAVAMIAGSACVAALNATRRASEMTAVARKEGAAAKHYASQASTRAKEARDNATRAETEARAARNAEQAAMELATAELAAKLLAQKETKRAEAASLRAESATKQAQDQLTKSEWLVYASKLMLAQSDFKDGDGNLAAHYLGDCQLNLRGWEYRYLSTRIKSKQTLESHIDSVTSVAFSPNDKWIVTGSADQSAKIWDAKSGTHLHTLNGHTGVVKCVAFSPDGQRVVSGSNDKTVKVWDSQTGQELLSISGYPAPVLALAFSPDQTRIAISGGTAYQPNMVSVRDAHTGLELLAIAGHQDRVVSLAFSPDGKRIVASHHDHSLRVFQTDSVLVNESIQAAFSLQGHTEVVRSVAFSPDGERIVSGSDDRTLKVWSAKTGRELFAIHGHCGGVTGVAFSPNSQLIASSSDDSTARVWEATTGRPLLVLKGHTGPVRGVTFNPNGKRIVTVSDDRSAKLWETQLGLELLSLKDHKTEVLCVAFSPDGQRIVTGTANPDNMARVWHAKPMP